MVERKHRKPKRRVLVIQLDMLDMSALTRRMRTTRTGKTSFSATVERSLRNLEHRASWLFWPVIIFPLYVMWQVVSYHGPGAPTIVIDPFFGIVLPLVLIAIMRVIMGFLGIINDDHGDPVKQFAQDNQLFLATNRNLPDEFEAIIFEQKGVAKHELFIADTQHDPDFFIATYQFMPEPGKFGDLYTIMSLKLPRQVTPIIIDARSNNMWQVSNLPQGFRIGPQLYLEGNFQKYFRLYCVEGEERNVLEVITPDRMVLFIDEFKDWDIEIWKDRIYLYQKKDISFEGGELPSLFRMLMSLSKEFRGSPDFSDWHEHRPGDARDSRHD